MAEGDERLKVVLGGPDAFYLDRAERAALAATWPQDLDTLFILCAAIYADIFRVQPSSMPYNPRLDRLDRRVAVSLMVRNLGSS